MNPVLKKFLKGCLSGFTFGLLALQCYRTGHETLGFAFIGVAMFGGILIDMDYL